MIALRRRRSGVDESSVAGMAFPSMQLAENGSEWHSKNLFAEIVADMQNPTAPVFGGRGHEQRSNHESGLLVRFQKISDGCATSIDPGSVSIGTVKEDLSHVLPLEKSEAQRKQ
jgi:hypothetical protein